MATRIPAKQLQTYGTLAELKDRLLETETGWCTDDNILYYNDGGTLKPVTKVVVIKENTSRDNITAIISAGCVPVVKLDLQGTVYLYPVHIRGNDAYAFASPISIGSGNTKDGYYWATVAANGAWSTGFKEIEAASEEEVLKILAPDPVSDKVSDADYQAIGTHKMAVMMYGSGTSSVATLASIGSGGAKFVSINTATEKLIVFDVAPNAVDNKHAVTRTEIPISGGGGGSSVDITSTDETVTITPSAGAFDLSIQSALDTKKDKQQSSDTSSTATKTLTRITQDTGGVVYPHFDDIDYTPANRNIALEYSPSETYPIIGTLRMHEGVLYKSKVVINTAEDWTEAHWEVTDIAGEISPGSSDYVDITSEWTFLNNFRLQYNGSIPGAGNAMTILYSRALSLVRFLGSMRINRTTVLENNWNTLLRYDGNRFYTTKDTDDPAFHPKIGETVTIGSQILVPASNESGTSIKALCKLAYTGSPTSPDGIGLSVQYIAGDARPSSVYGVILTDLVLRVTNKP